MAQISETLPFGNPAIPGAVEPFSTPVLLSRTGQFVSDAQAGQPKGEATGGRMVSGAVHPCDPFPFDQRHNRTKVRMMKPCGVRDAIARHCPSTWNRKGGIRDHTDKFTTKIQPKPCFLARSTNNNSYANCTPQKLVSGVSRGKQLETIRIETQTHQLQKSRCVRFVLASPPIPETRSLHFAVWVNSPWSASQMLNTSLAVSLVVVSVWSCLMVNACCVMMFPLCCAFVANQVQYGQ